ncbi:hypothetical protein L209DRAFT_778073 [Thermothelomyces heterothallicus CBS 203.75]
MCVLDGPSRMAIITPADYPQPARQVAMPRARIPSHVACLSQKADVTESYQKWIVIKNSTLPSNPAENLFGVELVSSIFYTQQRHKWIPELRETWRVLESGFEVHATKECSTHVHLSPASGPWTLSAARGGGPGMAQIFDDLSRAESLADLGERMCWCSRDSVHARQTLHQDDFVHPHFRWNLTALTESRTRTIEFRQPPASRNARDTLAWILFAACFTRWASERADAAFNPAEMPEIADLYRYVRAGAHVSVVPDDILALLEGLFRSAKPLPAPRHDLKGTTEEEMDELKTEAKRKGMSLEKYNKALFAYMSKGK